MSEEIMEIEGGKVSEFREVERKRKEWRRISMVKLYRVGVVENGVIYENMRDRKRLLVKAFENVCYVIEEEVIE